MNGGKKASEMIDDDIAVDWDGVSGTVTGTVKLIDDYSSAFPTKEKAGHFYPIKFAEKYYDQKVTISGREDGNKTVTPTEIDPYLIMRLENFAENPKATLESTGEEIFELDFSEATLPAVKAIGQTERAGYGTKTGADLMNEDVAIKWDGTNGTVTGTFKNVENWSELPSGSKTGHFFALKIDPKYKGKSFDFLRGAQQAGHSNSAGDDEMFWVLRIDTDKEFTFKSGGEVIAKLDFSGVQLG